MESRRPLPCGSSKRAIERGPLREQRDLERDEFDREERRSPFIPALTRRATKAA